MIQVIVLLEAKNSNALRAFEKQPVKIMEKYEGKLVAAFEPDASESSSSNITEIHCLEFPSIEAFKKYRTDPQYIESSELRKATILNTTVFESGSAKNDKE